MSWLSKLFGPREAPKPATVEHEGFTITPAPQQAGAQWRVGARIEKDGRVHDLVRADTMGDREACADASIAKAKQAIDQQGDRLFG